MSWQMDNLYRKKMHWLGDTPEYDNGSNGTSRRETYRNLKKRRRIRGQEQSIDVRYYCPRYLFNMNT